MQNWHLGASQASSVMRRAQLSGAQLCGGDYKENIRKKVGSQAKWLSYAEGSVMRGQDIRSRLYLWAT